VLGDIRWDGRVDLIDGMKRKEGGEGEKRKKKRFLAKLANVTGSKLSPQFYVWNGKDGNNNQHHNNHIRAEE